MRKLLWALPIVASLTACGSNQPTDSKAASSGATITGAGSTFVYPVLSAWASDYAAQTGTKVNYQSIGSGRRHFAGQGRHGRLRRNRPAAGVRRAGEDKLAQFPVVIGGIVAGREHPGHRAGQA